LDVVHRNYTPPPPTPKSLLAKTFKKICTEELKGTNISMTVTERGGRTLGQELGCRVPGNSEKEHCRREKCFTCNTVLYWTTENVQENWTWLPD